MSALISLLLGLYALVLIARVVLDLIAGGAENRLNPAVGTVRAGLRTVTEPVLRPVRRVLPPVRWGPVGLDLSVTVVLIGIVVLRTLLP